LGSTGGFEARFIGIVQEHCMDFPQNVVREVVHNFYVHGTVQKKVMNPRQNVFRRVSKIQNQIKGVNTKTAHQKTKEECAKIHALLRAHKKMFTSSELRKIRKDMEQVSRKLKALDLNAVPQQKRTLMNRLLRKKKATNQYRYSQTVHTYVQNMMLSLDKYHYTVFRSFPTSFVKGEVTKFRWEPTAEPHIKVGINYKPRKYMATLRAYRKALDDIFAYALTTLDMNNHFFKESSNNVYRVTQKIDEMIQRGKAWEAVSPTKKAKLQSKYRAFSEKFQAMLAQPRARTDKNNIANEIHYYGFQLPRSRGWNGRRPLVNGTPIPLGRFITPFHR